MTVTGSTVERGPTSLTEEARLSGEFADWHNLIYDVSWLTGPVDIAAVRDAWSRVCLRHDGLRRTYVSPTEACTHSDPLSEVELHTAATDAEALEKMRQSLGTPFDLFGPAFARIVIVQRSEQRHLLGIAVDHIVSDRISWFQLCGDFSELYERALAGDAADSTEQGTYRSFAAQMRRDFSGAWGRQRREFWRAYTAEFGTFPPPFSIRAQHGGEPSIKMLERELPADARATAFAAAQQAKATPFAVAAAGVLAGMREVSGDQVVGLTTHHHGRMVPGAFRTIGLFAQAVPLYLRSRDTDPLETVRDVFAQSLEVAEQILPLQVAGRAWSENLMSPDRAAGVFVGMVEGRRPGAGALLAGTSAQSVEMTFPRGKVAQNTLVIGWNLHETEPQVTAAYDENAFAAASVEQILDTAMTRVADAAKS